MALLCLFLLFFQEGAFIVFHSPSLALLLTRVYMYVK